MREELKERGVRVESITLIMLPLAQVLRDDQGKLKGQHDQDALKRCACVYGMAHP